jgi:hypothetical protein
MGSERFLMASRDERFQRIDIHATAFAGTVVIAAVS